MKTHTSIFNTVLFDLDGTLADTAPDLANALNAVRCDRGHRPLPYERIRPVVSHGTNALIELGFQIRPDNKAFDEIKGQLLDFYQAHIAVETRLFPGMAEVLRTIEAQGKNWGVVTNKPGYLTTPLMQALHLEERAACIVSGDTTARPKPDPAPMYHACKLAGSRAEQCLYIGDAKRDIEAGRNAGMKTLAALFGYLNEADTPSEWGADGLIQHPSDILNWLTWEPAGLG
ncbi:MAG TPA: HAD family hydrolase [Candidatus Tenderia sp.]|nr:HAD family hydrolase [Candidatus Tenderia sp.]